MFRKEGGSPIDKISLELILVESLKNKNKILKFKRTIENLNLDVVKNIEWLNFKIFLQINKKYASWSSL